MDAFFRRLIPVLKHSRHLYEIICIDDGSSDRSAEYIHAWIDREPAVHLIKLTRNFGKERALAAGIDYASGDAVIPIDADLQDPPEVILQLIEQWQMGFDMVIASRRSRVADTRMKRQSANWFYRIMNRFSEVELPSNAGDFRLLDRKVVDALKRLPESTRFHKGLFAWVGFRTCTVEFERPERADGTTKWSYWKLWNFALDGIFSFSTAPLKLWTYIGFVCACTGFAYALFVIARTLLLGIDVPGYASLLVLVLVLHGFSMIGIGIVGEYVGRIFNEVKHRPLYLIESVERTDPLTGGATGLPTDRDVETVQKITR
jgi:glycosyltransferase involved in cell wall biosynthesis